MAKKPTNYAINEERPYGILISGHYREELGYSVHRPSGSVDWLLMYTLSGEGVVRTAEEDVLCREGDAAILLPGIPHQYGTHGEAWEFLWVHFIPDPDWSPWLRLPVRSERFFHLSLPAEVRHAVVDPLNRMHRHSLRDGRTALHGRLSELALEEALIQVRLAASDVGEIAMDSRIAEVLRYLQFSFKEKIGLPELAQLACLSPSRLSHLFKEEVGDTILNTVNKFRLEKAAQLLSCTSRRISEISSDVGFESTDHFTRMFQQSFGETPSKYRKRKTSL
ncbi:helix-turn-helix domain-containing protein [Cohnella thailandensis]|uniref:Helix-turn-helix domain-containing protein n=2 Tax=Cohnella thailandensis TaxID=557557 RepID=A0A841STM6_9BACL|nr:helix-turn-helix domain-containing protein [Cohnella thailandensis]MBB6634582.1 helix-turn-helix domain-containing protein [Cohnella thailandensis]